MPEMSPPLPMNIWIVQLVVTPPFERPHQQGFIVHVEIAEEASEIRSARLWRRDHQGMDWMQEAPIHDIQQGTPEELPLPVATAILESVRSPSVCVAAKGDFGYIHPTSFQLTIRSGWNACSIGWFHELPQEWTQLQPAVQALEVLGRDVTKRT